MRISGLFILAAVALCNVFAWAMLNRPAHEVAWEGVINGVSYSPYTKFKSPLLGDTPTRDEIEADLQVLQGKVAKVRTYSSSDGAEAIPELAQKYAIAVTAGAWLDKDLAKNSREITSLIHNTRKHSNIERVIVGNEALLRGDLSVKELGAYLRKVRKQVNVPVSTAEPWHVWLKYPELAENVDFIAIHILPYWEGISEETSLDFVLDSYQKVVSAFPGKLVLIAEVGWPSQGNRFLNARPTLANEAKFLRRFLNLAQKEHLDYFVMEAFDQPWKRATEGAVGPSWGIFDAARSAKFAMTGAIVTNPLWPIETIAATGLALLPIIAFLYYFKEVRTRGRLFFAFLVQSAASLLIWTAFIPLTEDLTNWGTAIWCLLLPAQFALLLVVLANGFELTELLWSKHLKRHFAPISPSRHRLLPKVSIHVAICNEPPEMVIATLNSLAALDYPSFEVLVIDNNTKDPVLWEPVAAHCKELGSKFRFFSLGKWPGYKAGALNFALQHTDPAAAVIGIVDSDYIVKSDWLRSLTPYFDEADVGFVQAPQDHREWQGDSFKSMCNWEYAGFFHIGMVHRNERNAIIQHGTMTLIRKAALMEEKKGWSEWCICEDAELGLRLLSQGYKSVYVNVNSGHGLTPDSFAGFKGQRFRWAYGAVQILKRYWPSLLPWKPSQLTLGQRYHFIMGWLPWFGDALQILFTIAALVWTTILLLWPHLAEFPVAAFLLPTLGTFAFKIIHALWLYKSKVPCSLPQRIAAALAGMALTHTIACAVFKALFTSNQPFLRTPKAENKPAFIKGVLMAREELLILIALWMACMGVAWRYDLHNPEAFLWAAVLVILSLPYVAALICSLMSVIPPQKSACVTSPVSAPPPQSPEIPQQREAA